MSKLQSFGFVLFVTTLTSFVNWVFPCKLCINKELVTPNKRSITLPNLALVGGLSFLLMLYCAHNTSKYKL